jgi:hypothetical protein
LTGNRGWLLLESVRGNRAAFTACFSRTKPPVFG